MTTPEQQPFKHALSAEDLVLPGECPASLDELRSTLRQQYQPCNVTESILVNEIAEQFWRVRRMRALEARAMQPESVDALLEGGLLAFIARSMASAERGFHRAISTLQKLQAGRGFVPSKTREPLSAPIEKSKPAVLPPQGTRDFGDLDVPGILADYDEELHPFVLEDLAALQSIRKRIAAAKEPLT
jgi:hypothetical protein